MKARVLSVTHSGLLMSNQFQDRLCSTSITHLLPSYYTAALINILSFVAIGYDVWSRLELEIFCVGRGIYCGRVYKTHALRVL